MLYHILSALALVCSIGGKLIINKHLPVGYFIWIFSNIAWIVVHFIQPYTNWWQVTMYAAYILLNSHGIAVHWRLWRNKATMNDLIEIGDEWEGEEGG